MNSKRRWRTLAAAGVASMLFAMPAAAHELQLTGIVRDFKRGDWAGGHPDFQTASMPGRGGFGRVSGLTTMFLDEQRKPVYNPSRPSIDTIFSQDSFNQWYVDVPEVNLSAPLTLTLTNGLNHPGGIYTYENNAFWVIDGQMFGNQGLNHNFHFTFELHTQFAYSPGQKFRFIGDDDVWVYINGVKVIDLGGVHAAQTAEVLLFDGKAFVNKNHFASDGVVQVVSKQMRNAFAQKWTNLGLGTCPIAENDKFIELNLNHGQTEVRAVFNGTSVTCYSTQDLSNVVVQFADGTEQKFDNLNQGTSGTFTGTGAYAGKQIVGCWIKSGANQSGDGPGKGSFISVNGQTETPATLDFFFAERHTTQSNFRIDTSIVLESTNTTTISPLYD